MTAADDREAAKALLHEAFHSLNPRISGLEAGECHCNLLAEVGLDALNFGDALAAAEARGVERGYRRAVERLRDGERYKAWLLALSQDEWTALIDPDGYTTPPVAAAYLEAVEGDDRADTQ